MQTIPTHYFPYDKDPIEVLEDVTKIWQDLLYEVNGIKVKKTEVPLEDLSMLTYIGTIYTPSLDINNMMGIEIRF